MTIISTTLPEYEMDLVLGEAWVVMRLDGRGFTRGARDYTRPFDLDFHMAMRKATEALFAVSPLLFAHTASDEINLVFTPRTNWFNGRGTKWLSVTAATASSALSRSLVRFVGFPTVDAKAFRANNLDEVKDYLLERLDSSWRNCRNGYVYYGLMAKGLTASAADRKVRAAEKGDLDYLVPKDLPGWQRFGAVAHYNAIPHIGHNPLTNVDVPTTRRKLGWHEFARMSDIDEMLNALR